MPGWKSALLGLLALAGPALGHSHDAETVPQDRREELLMKWEQEVRSSTPPDGDRSTNLPQWPFSGVASFAHLPPVKCLVEPDARYDIAVVGAPFDTAVSYRPGR